MGSVRQFRDKAVTDSVPIREASPELFRRSDAPAPMLPGEASSTQLELRRLAHEFNNLLTGATLFSDLLIDALEHDPALLRYAQEIRLASEQGRTLVAELRALAVTAPNSNNEVRKS